jgi:crossover junction endodeoxyribonuclease RuvC
MARSAIRIIGLDPGLRRTGWGIVDCEGNRLTYIACGSVETSERESLAVRLSALHAGMPAVIASHATQ